MKQAYIEKRFAVSSQVTIAQANMIIEEYQAENLQLTLRQLYYQFVSRGWMANQVKEYNRLGDLISNGRLAGLIDWNAIEDRSRNLQSLSHWKDPGEIIQTCVWSFRVDHWEGQEYRPEVWIEKEALAGVIEGICRELDVPFFACKGYVSQSEMWRAGQRLRGHVTSREAIPVVIHLGDHDPSGIDMTRDIRERLELLSGLAQVEVERIALNMDQISQYNPPPNPAKTTDSRFGSYIVEYGNESWELDALDPKTLRDLIDVKVRKYRDEEVYNDVLAQERKYRNILRHVSYNWEDLDVEGDE